MENKSTILIVDDEPSIRMGLAATIKRYGYEVITAVDGDDGFLKARHYLPDLIVSDVMMPSLNGFEMKKQMSVDPLLAHIPFIFLTARITNEDRVSGLRDGADDYVTKPFVTEELMARIEAVMRRVRTEQERGREQVKQAAQDEMEKLRREVLQNFSHELRTPLGNVMMSLDIMMGNKFKSFEEQQEFLRIAYSSADRLESLVADIILLSDIDQNRLNLMRQVIDIEHHILIPVKRRLVRYDEKQVNFVYDINAAGTIKAPRREFTQSLVHLADNAFKFSPQRGRVKLTVKPGNDGGVTITIQDEGIGIAADLREKVFERFYQVSQGDGREFQGLGIGLTIARIIFSSLGGGVKLLESSEGCSVLATLPDLRQEDVSYG
jgi:two-component system sensor histidine kinase/response regulator